MEVLSRALASETVSVLLAALRAVAHLGPLGAPLVADLRPFLMHPEPAVRLTDIHAGARDPDWRGMLQAEEDLDLRLACMSRLVESAGIEAISDLLRLLRDPEWEMRSAAGDALASLGDPAAAATRPLLGDPEIGVRSAAAATLLALGKDAWLSEDLELQAV